MYASHSVWSRSIEPTQRLLLREITLKPYAPTARMIPQLTGSKPSRRMTEIPSSGVSISKTHTCIVVRSPQIGELETNQVVCDARAFSILCTSTTVAFPAIVFGACV
jgi:hypothetical protein